MEQYRKVFLQISLFLIGFIVHSFAQETPPEKDCPSAPKDVKELKIEIYFNGPSNGSRNFFPQLCDAYHAFGGALSISLKVGAYVGFAPSGKIVCNFFPNEDCTEQYQYACAYTMLSDFKKFVCCHLNEKKELNQCLTDQGVDLDKFKTCYERKDPNYDPQVDILNNSKYLYEKAPNVTEFPAPFLNGKYDQCIFEQHFYHWLKTVCKCYAVPKPKPCK